VPAGSAPAAARAAAPRSGRQAPLLSGADWSTWMFNPEHTGDNGKETTIPPDTPPWTDTTVATTTRQRVSAQPVTYTLPDGTLARSGGSWNGYLYGRNAATGQPLPNWTNPPFLGTTPGCPGLPGTVGVGSTPTGGGVAGRTDPVVFVGAGTTLYAYDAVTGGPPLWSQPLGTDEQQAGLDPFLWSPPVLYTDTSTQTTYVYVGRASLNDCPTTVQGRLYRFNATTGTPVGVFDVVPNGCMGGGIGSAPPIDPTDPAGGAVYIAPGNAASTSRFPCVIQNLPTCVQGSNDEPSAQSIVKRSLDLTQVLGGAHLPFKAGSDSDFGAPPPLFTEAGQVMVGAINKNGNYYAFTRASFAGLNQFAPVAWQETIAVGGIAPQAGQGSIASSAWMPSLDALYIAGGTTTDGQCQGSLQAFNLSTLPPQPLWMGRDRVCFSGTGAGPVLAPVPAIPGMVVVSEGTMTIGVDTATGMQTLFSYQDPYANG
jgi:hypothetical protein